MIVVEAEAKENSECYVIVCHYVLCCNYKCN